MKKGLFIAGRGVVYFMTAAVLSVLLVLLPELAREEAEGKAHPPESLPFFIGAWILSIPIFIALYQTHKLIKYVEGNKAFSVKSVRALQIIKYCAISFAVMIIISAISLVVIVHGAHPEEDMVPVGPIGFVFVFPSIVIATFAAVLQKLLRQAIDIKSENDLTV